MVLFLTGARAVGWQWRSRSFFKQHGWRTRWTSLDFHAWPFACVAIKTRTVGCLGWG